MLGRQQLVNPRPRVSRATLMLALEHHSLNLTKPSQGLRVPLSIHRATEARYPNRKAMFALTRSTRPEFNPH